MTAYVSVTDNYNYNLEGTVSRAPGRRRLEYAVTNEQTITKLAELINALPAAPNQDIVVPCTSSLGPAYKLDFQDSQGAAPVAEVSIVCFGVMVSVHGHNEPIRGDSIPPGDTGSVLQNVAALLADSMPHVE
ncbi:MAG: hypothetical protein ACJ786_15490 [Catenulispora sp.]